MACITPGGLFDGPVEMCSAGVGSMGASTGFNVGACNMSPRSGNRMGSSFEAHPVMTFALGTERVGGYLRPILGGRTVRFSAYDAAGVEIGNDTTTLSACAWTWIGLESHGAPIASVSLQYSFGDDFYVAYDDWNADLIAPAIVNYCVATQNSSGAPAAISAQGTASLAANNIVLRAGPAPTGEFGIFVTGTERAQLVLGNGTLCVGGSIVRLPGIAAVTGTGDLVSVFDHGVFPGPAILVGDTVNFQAWFRDGAAGGAGFNLSDGLAITFTP